MEERRPFINLAQVVNYGIFFYHFLNVGHQEPTQELDT